MNIIKRFILGRVSATVVMQSGAAATGDIVGGDKTYQEIEFPEDLDRAPETSRRVAAVERLISAGFSWDGEQWVMPQRKESARFSEWHRRRWGSSLSSYDALRDAWMARAAIEKLA